MKRLLALDLGVTDSVTLDEDGATAVMTPSKTGEVTISMAFRLSPQAAVAMSRALAKFALRHLPESMHAEISDGIPTMVPAYETTDVNAPAPPSRVSG